MGRPTETALAGLRERGFSGARVALVLGSGLTLGPPFVREIETSYGDIPGFPTTSVAGHRGRLSRWSVARSEGELLVMEGRPHLYEGWSMDEVAFPVRLLAALGVRVLLLTNAAGGLNPEYGVGEFMLLADHLSFLPPDLGFASGGEAAGWERTRGQSPYDPEVRAMIHDHWLPVFGPLHTGLYAAVLGPNYETPAEIALYRDLGADAIGMSTATEATVAAQCGMRVAGLSLISNSLAAPSEGPLTHLEVLGAGKQAAERFSSALAACWSELLAHAE